MAVEASPPIGFLVGAERSGTTMLRLMLSHHPELTWLYESEFLVDYMPAAGQWPDLDEILDEYAETIEFKSFLERWHLSRDDSLDYQAQVGQWLAKIHHDQGGARTGLTIHRHFDRLHSLVPDAHYIHLYRDGHDVANSRIGMGWAGNLWVAAHDWIAKETLWDSIEKQLPEARYLNVKYEDLVENPEEELTRICKFLNVSFHPDMLSYPDKSTYSAPDPKLSYQWKKRFSDREKQLVESVQGEWLRRRNYDLSGLPELKLSRISQMWLKLHSRLLRMRFRYRRQGLGLFLASALSRRLGTKRWRQKVYEKERIVREQYVK